MIDSHCHLNDPQFNDDVVETLERAREAGVEACLVAGYDRASSQRAEEMATHPLIWIALGVHPHDASAIREDANWGQLLIEKLRAHPRVAAVGEMGLDYHYNFSPRDVQREAFRAQIQIARQLNLPVTIHSRAAEDEVMDTLVGEGVPEAGAVLHAFTGSQVQLQRALEMGLLIGVGGMVTFKKADDLRALISRVPLDRLLLETDAPYLTPHPFRGRRNEPAFLVHVVAALAQLFDCTEEQIDRQTTDNALRVFTHMRGAGQ
ncbi:MAG: TatD family hydrolase [Armatimonadetes bacterium]|nr:TatD family hydrolase [Armatimonadota bacterium]